MYWIIAAFCAYFIKGLCGFANTLVFNTILMFTVTNIEISPVELMLSFPSNIILTVKNRKNLNIKIWLPVGIMVLCGSVVGVIFLKNTDTAIIKKIFGAVVICIALEMLFSDKVKRTGKNNILLTALGILSGILCGLYGIGALLAAYMNHVSDDQNDFKGNLNMIFCMEGAFRIVLYIATGIITLQTFKNAVMLYPVMLIALFIGMKSSRGLDDKIVRKIVIVMLIISGIALIVRS